MRYCRNDQRVRGLAYILNLDKALAKKGIFSSPLTKANNNIDVDHCGREDVLDWKESFVPQRLNFQSICDREQPYDVHRRQSRKRLVSNYEKFEVRKRRGHQSKKSSCTFCGQEGHKITNCGKRNKYSHEGHEYVISNMSPHSSNCDILIENLRMSRAEPVDTVLGVKHMHNSKNGSRNIIVKKSYYNTNVNSKLQRLFEKMQFDVVFIDKNGDLIDPSQPLRVQGDALQIQLKYSATCSKKRYVYDNTERDELHMPVVTPNRVVEGMKNPFDMSLYADEELEKKPDPEGATL